MALLGTGALAMWWDMAPAMQGEFQHWHTHEHFPERLAVPGFLRASRWADADGGEGFFILYEVRDFGVLASDAYLAHLNSPTPWSTKLMPHHRNMVRSQCRVVHSEGGAVAGHALTIRLRDGEGAAALLAGLSMKEGIGGAHLLQAQAPAIAQTTEQKIRGGKDRVADWVVVLVGYDADALLAAAGPLAAREGAVTGRYRLAMSMP
ncbi:hypothetical protein [Ramlibacter sp. PS4R-6]|uniref:hypothetical protein n=1 Tax=Ramlibacter sp. PS4R-6 TaxID=3133438 RepID=UPI0030964394